MKFYYYLLIISFLFFSCTEEEAPTFAKNYGEGLYIATSNGVSFYKDGLVKNQIFKEVNGITLQNVNKIKFKGSKAYVATRNNLYSANIETFENKGSASLFKNIADFDFVSSNRIFVVDKEDSKVQVVNMDRMEITGPIETGDSTMPVFITSRWYRSIVMNGGAAADSLKDSTIVAIDYRDELVPLADFNGSIYVGDNPNSAVWVDNLRVLCKGIYDENNMTNNTESSLSKVDAWDMELDWNIVLSNVYNANNLISDKDSLGYYFTAEGGIYSMSNSGTGVFCFLDDVVSDVLLFQDERYSVYNPADSTTTYFNRDVLYINDAQNSKNTIYKYNLDIGAYIDTIIVDAPVKDIAFY